MKHTLATLCLLALLGCRLLECEGHCVAYGLCHTDDMGRKQSCLDEGPPRPLVGSKGLAILQKRCPELYSEGPILTCCNSEQLEILEEQFLMMGNVFGRCPSCFYNIGKQMCAYTCNANQSDYTQIISVQTDDLTQKRYVSEVNAYITKSFVEGTFDSCSQIIMPSIGKRAVDTTCGIYTGDQCTAERWFSYLGDSTKNPVSPMKVNFMVMNHTFLNYKAFDAPVIKCHEAYQNDSACSCSDCAMSCPAPPSYPKLKSSFKIGEADGLSVVMAIVFIAVVSSFFAAKSVMGLLPINKIHKTLVSHYVPEVVKESYFNNLRNHMEKKMGYFFFQWGKVIAGNPTLVLAIASWIVAILCYGAQYLIITTDPIQIWASPSSQSRIEKDYFESKFEPFYRTEQIFIKHRGLKPIQHETVSGVIEFGPVFNKEFLLAVHQLQEEIEKIPGLMNICFAPLSTNNYATNISQCTVMSVWGYFQNDVSFFNKTSTDAGNYTTNYLNHLYDCFRNNINQDCLAPYGGNVEPAIAVGSYLQYGKGEFQKAEALVLSYMVNNYVEPDKLKPALAWETRFVEVLQNWSTTKMPPFMDIAFRAERSIEDELERESVAELVTVVISYVLMFLYISLALGTFISWRTIPIGSKIGLGLGGVGVVLVSVVCSLGVFGYIGCPTTLLTIEVIPFLVLAVGVDNMFILVSHHEKNRNPRKRPAECIGQTLGEVGPSLVLTTFSEAACFAIGGLVDMPAVRTFAFYGTVALLIDFLLQITVFIAFLTINTIRVHEKRVDIFCCFKINSELEVKQTDGWIHLMFQKYIIPIIFKPIIRPAIFLLFIFWLCASIACIPHIEPGLEQQLSMPEDSFVTKYFEFMDEILSMGPPVYFVLKSGLNFSHLETQNLICGGLSCRTDSLSTQIFTASKESDITYIATHASSWLDDYNDWSSTNGCCKTYRNGSFCPHSDTQCISCNITLDSGGHRPDPESFQKFLPYFLQDNPDTTCAKAGHAAYFQGVNFEYDNYGRAQAADSYFMAYHTTLKTSEDYYQALKMARLIAQNISAMLSSARPDEPTVEVFPYSIFYVFYEQYLTIWETSLEAIGLSLLAVFIVTLIFTGIDLVSSLIVLCTVLMIVVDLAGLMFWWDINLNAITLVNLVMAVGISVEFSSHIVHAFNQSSKVNKIDRAKDALINMGTSVFSGITMTKFLGIIVLAFAKTQIFRVFYFRMYLGIVLFGAVHGLIFLPIFLSYVGAGARYPLS